MSANDVAINALWLIKRLHIPTDQQNKEVCEITKIDHESDRLCT